MRLQDRSSAIQDRRPAVRFVTRSLKQAPKLPVGSRAWFPHIRMAPFHHRPPSQLALICQATPRLKAVYRQARCDTDDRASNDLSQDVTTEVKARPRKDRHKSQQSP